MPPTGGLPGRDYGRAPEEYVPLRREGPEHNAQFKVEVRRRKT